MSFEVQGKRSKGHSTKNSQYRLGLQVLNDGIGVLVSLGLATEVTSEGLKRDC